MKRLLSSFLAGLTLMLASTVARAEFTTWKNKDGKAAELEISGVEGEQVYFRTKAGKEVILKLEDLAAEDQERVKDWDKERKKAPALTTTFSHVKKRGKGQPPGVEFVFDLKPEIGLVGYQAKLSNMKATVGGKDLEVRKWEGLVDDGITTWDPFSEGPRPTKRVWTLVVRAEGDFGNVAVEDCEFSADIAVPCGRSPREVSGMFPLPKGPESDHDVEKELAPLTVILGSKAEPSYKAGRRGDGMVTTGYYLGAGKVVPAENGQSTFDRRSVFHQAFVVKGKEHVDTIAKDEATNPIKVVVKYWTEVYDAPLHLSKAASNKGSAPVKEGKGGGGAKGGGGKDPFKE